MRLKLVEIDSEGTWWLTTLGGVMWVVTLFTALFWVLYLLLVVHGNR